MVSFPEVRSGTMRLLSRSYSLVIVTDDDKIEDESQWNDVPERD